MTSAANTVDVRDMDSKSIKKHLFQIAMKSQWKEVVQAYRLRMDARKARITRSGDTALHIAVLDSQEDCVEELVELVSEEELSLLNERGNTPLHFAAAMGNVRMCNCIAKVDPTLVGILNRDKETPLFLAALQGKKDAFLCLHYICTPDKESPPNYNYCRRENGQTILHCAIAGHYFDLAFQIIALYKDLVYSLDEDGYSPLHLLASQPSTFRSGTHLSLRKSIIYNCILVDELKCEQADHFKERIINRIDSKKDLNYPENNRTCVNFLLLFKQFRKMAKVFFAKEWPDPEKPTKVLDGGNPGHYRTCFDFIKLLSEAMLIILALGSTEISKIKYMKEKHKWAVQIMDKLLADARTYEYDDIGKAPELGRMCSQPIFNFRTATMDNETMPYKISDDGDITFGSIEEQLMPLPPSRNQQNKNRGSNETNVQEQKQVIGEGLSVGTRKIPEMKKPETPILIAAKNGVTEMVEKIVETYPVAFHDVDSEDKNIVLLAVENKQTYMYQLLLKRSWNSALGEVDTNWNSALHLAARLGNIKPRLNVVPALQMQWEVKWFEYVKTSMGAHFYFRYNKENKTAEDIFTESHSKLFQEGVEWLSKTSESCTLIASLVATVSFATATTIPGGIEESGRPILANQPVFEVFAVSSLVALCFSVTSLFIFLSVLLSRYQQKDFASEVPWKLLLGLSSLFVSMVSMMVSFCAGHYFMLKDKLGHAALLVYVMTFLPAAYFVAVQFPLYVQLIRANFSTVPLHRIATHPM